MGAITTRPSRRRAARPEPPRGVDLVVWQLAVERASHPTDFLLHPSDFILSRTPVPPGDPTPEEIAAACREIRASWTDFERIKRLIPHIGEPNDRDRRRRE